jgi:hypothetical protein
MPAAPSILGGVGLNRAVVFSAAAEAFVARCVATAAVMQNEPSRGAEGSSCQGQAALATRSFPRTRERLRGRGEVGMPASELVNASNPPHVSRQRTQAYQSPLMPAHAGIQLSHHRRKPLKKLDSRVRGNERDMGARLLSLRFVRVRSHIKQDQVGKSSKHSNAGMSGHSPGMSTP